MTFTVPKFREKQVEVGVGNWPANSVPTNDEIKLAKQAAFGDQWEEWTVVAGPTEKFGPNGQLFQVYVCSRQIA